MPELPEVETTRLGITPLIKGRVIEKCVVRNGKLRWPVPADLASGLQKQKILSITRRAKYLRFHCAETDFVVHLGMSGSLRFITEKEPPRKHDHIDWVFADGTLRYHDPRRFGCVLWLESKRAFNLLESLGPEPLSDLFSEAYLFDHLKKRQKNIKSALMDNKIVVGVGNIYAQEALFLAKINPQRASNSITFKECDQLVSAVKTILGKAIETGGTTLKDFVNPDGNPGYFAQSLKVYGRAGAPCRVCGEPLEGITLGNRATVYCERCQG